MMRKALSTGTSKGSLLLAAVLFLVGHNLFGQAPTISTISPTSGPVGTLVTITGTNLNNLTSFQIAGVDAIEISNDGTTLVGFVMPGATTGTADVTTVGGSVSSGQSFTVTSPTPISASQIGSDIDGNVAFGLSGTSVSLSADGQTLAIGAPDANSSAGTVRVYENNAGTWTQIGSDIDGEASFDQSGISVSLSADGRTLAIGAYNNDGTGASAGHVRVYENNAGTWTQIGADIDGEAASDQSGISVSLSADGQTVAIGAHANDDAGPEAGHVRVYKNNAGTWTQIGADIDGETAGDQSGYSVSLSADGQTVAIGSPVNDDAGSDAGQVRVYKNMAGVWTQLGADILGESGGDQSGFSVSLSADGQTLAIGAPFNDNVSFDDGHVRVYKYNAGTWTQVGADINGEGSSTDDRAGSSVSLSADGNTLAMGTPYNYNNSMVGVGQVRLYTNNAGTWTQVGADIDGELINDLFGSSVSLSANGLTLASGAPYNDGGGTSTGHVRVFEIVPSSLFTNETATQLSGVSPILSGTTTFADFDNDNDMDLLIAGDNTAEVWRNNGSGTFSNVTASAITIPLGYSIDARLNSESAWGDFDSDGDLDLLYGGDEEFNTASQRSWLLRNDGGTFSDATPGGFPGVQDGTFNWVDFDNDGDLDISLNGFTGSSPIVTTQLWENNAGTFTNETATLAPGVTPIWLGKMRWTDFDNDGDQDFLLAGTDNAGDLAIEIWRNGTSGAVGTFALYASYDPGQTSDQVPATAEWGDYDADGDQDFVVSWYHGGAGLFHTEIYRNNSGTFADVTATAAPGLPQVIESSLAWIDYDNDGDLDLMISGVDVGDTRYTQLWKNTSGVFALDPNALIGISGLSQTAVAWADVDNDADLDFVITGYNGTSSVTQLWINGSSSNGTPAIPGGLSSSVSGNDVTLTWSATTDLTTPAASITYNVYIGTATQKEDVVAPNGSIPGGYRRIAAPGNAGVGTTFSIYGLDPGTYYWSVQAVDNGLLGSAFAGEGTFTIGSIPTITSFSPASGPVGTSVAITGTNFDPTPANNIVYVGKMKATVTAASATSLTITVPSGATYQPIEVNVNGLIAQSFKPFNVTFSGGQITSGTFVHATDLTGLNNPRLAAIGDLDLDGKPDIAIANNVSTGSVSVFRNTTTSGSPTFATKVDLATSNSPYSVFLTDLDGDGKLDLAGGSSSQSNVNLLLNSSSGSGNVNFLSAISLTTSVSRWTGTGDLDSDGKLDLLIPQTTSNSISVFPNITAAFGGISLGSESTTTVNNEPFLILAGDLDSDGKIDLATTNYIGNSVSILRNTSSGTGNFAFAALQNLAAGSFLHYGALADFDGDGRLDLVVAQYLSNKVSFYRNTTVSIGSISFVFQTEFTLSAGPIDLDVGDLDGNGYPDVAVANGANFSVIKNLSSNSGAILFDTPIDVSLPADATGIKIADLNNDSRPDIAVTVQPSNMVSIYENTPSATQFSSALSGTGNEFATATAIDASGNIFTTGYFTGTVDFDPSGAVNNLISAGGNDIFILKLDNTGNFVWANRIGSSGDDKGNAIGVDSNGDIFITGHFTGTVDLDPGAGTATASSAGDVDIFVVKLSSSGSFVWSKRFGGTDVEDATALHVAYTDEPVIAGHFYGNSSFGPPALPGSSEIFVARLSGSDGTPNWTRTYGGSENESVSAITGQTGGELYMTGTFSGSPSFSGNTPSNAGLNNGYLCQLNLSDGAANWVRSFGGTENDRAWGLSVDGTNGFIYVAGEFSSTATIGTGVSSNGGYDLWVAKYNTAGTHIWTRTVGGAGNDAAYGIATDGTNVFVTGIFYGTVDFDASGSTNNLTSAGSYDAFMLKLDSNGNFISASHAGGTGYDSGQSVSLSGSTPYVSGYFNEDGDFDPGAGTTTLFVSGGYDAFVMCFCN